MPDAARKICRDCGRTAEPNSVYCAAHQTDNRAARSQRERSQIRRDQGLKRLYDSADWRRRTVRFILSRDPLCQLGVLCGGRAISTDVDHILRAEDYIAARGGDQAAFFDTDNLRGVCHADHSRKTMLENQRLWQEPGPIDPD
jgi:5-methylcytosine-specific restriction protein A